MSERAPLVIPWYAFSMTAAKIAVTVPRETFLAVEKRRRALGTSRSAVVTAALEAWLANESMTAEEQRYILAYLREPETDEFRALSDAALASWEPWDRPKRRQRKR